MSSLSGPLSMMGGARGGVVKSWKNLTFHGIYSKTFIYFLALGHLIPYWLVSKEIECTGHVGKINKFKQIQ